MQTKHLSFVFTLVVAGLLLSLAPHVGLAEGVGSGIENPLGNPDQTITDVLRGIINWMLGLVGIIALIALISAGARMIFGFVDEDQVKKAKTTILWAVIGLAVVILSYAIINIVTTEILGAGSGNGSGSQYEGGANRAGTLPGAR